MPQLRLQSATAEVLSKAARAYAAAAAVPWVSAEAAAECVSSGEDPAADALHQQAALNAWVFPQALRVVEKQQQLSEQPQKKQKQQQVQVQLVIPAAAREGAAAA